MKDMVLTIEGMSCNHCLNAVSRALGELPSVIPKSIRIGRAELQYDENVVEASRIVKAVEEEGYEVEVERSGSLEV
ncbi:MAG: cation transporter [Gemmatimonadales bacterium]